MSKPSSLSYPESGVGELSGVRAVLSEGHAASVCCVPLCVCALPACVSVWRISSGLEGGLGGLGTGAVSAPVSVSAQRLSGHKLVPGLRVSSLEIYCF